MAKRNPQKNDSNKTKNGPKNSLPNINESKSPFNKNNKLHFDLNIPKPPIKPPKK